MIVEMIAASVAMSKLSRARSMRMLLEKTARYHFAENAVGGKLPRKSRHRTKGPSTTIHRHEQECKRDPDKADRRRITQIVEEAPHCAAHRRGVAESCDEVNQHQADNQNHDRNRARRWGNWRLG